MTFPVNTTRGETPAASLPHRRKTTRMRILRILLIVAALTLLYDTCGAEEPRETSSATERLSQKFEPVFHAALDWFASNPTVSPGDPERERILKTLDPPLAEENAVNIPAVGRFFHARMAGFLSDLDTLKPHKGAVIWKLYNHTNVIRTPQLTIAIDLIGGPGQLAWDNAALDRAINHIDLLLITHEHGDHADPTIVKKFLKAGKQVIVQKNMWKYESYSKKLTRMHDGAATFKDVRLSVFPSFQTDTPNNIYLIETSDGLKIMHVGDENEVERAPGEWYRSFEPPLEIDLLLPNCWCPNLGTLLQYVKPKLMVPGHEHELTHGSASRRSYNYVFSVLSKMNVPFLVLAWGEKISLDPKAGRVLQP